MFLYICLIALLAAESSFKAICVLTRGFPKNVGLLTKASHFVRGQILNVSYSQKSDRDKLPLSATGESTPGGKMMFCSCPWSQHTHNPSFSHWCERCWIKYSTVCPFITTYVVYTFYFILWTIPISLLQLSLILFMNSAPICSLLLECL